MYTVQNKVWGAAAAHQVVELGVFAEEGLVVLLLLVHKVLDVHVEAGRRDALGALRGLLTLLKQQRQQGEQRVSGGPGGRGRQSQRDRDRQRESRFYTVF